MKYILAMLFVFVSGYAFAATRALNLPAPFVRDGSVTLAGRSMPLYYYGNSDYGKPETRWKQVHEKRRTILIPGKNSLWELDPKLYRLHQIKVDWAGMGISSFDDSSTFIADDLDYAVYHESMPIVKVDIMKGICEPRTTLRVLDLNESRVVATFKMGGDYYDWHFDRRNCLAIPLSAEDCDTLHWFDWGQKRRVDIDLSHQGVSPHVVRWSSFRSGPGELCMIVKCTHYTKVGKGCDSCGRVHGEDGKDWFRRVYINLITGTHTVRNDPLQITAVLDTDADFALVEDKDRTLRCLDYIHWQFIDRVDMTARTVFVPRRLGRYYQKWELPHPARSLDEGRPAARFQHRGLCVIPDDTGTVQLKPFIRHDLYGRPLIPLDIGQSYSPTTLCSPDKEGIFRPRHRIKAFAATLRIMPLSADTPHEDIKLSSPGFCWGAFHLQDEQREALLIICTPNPYSH